MRRLRRRWLVNYRFSGGTGRIFMTTKRLFLSERLVKDMDAYLSGLPDTSQEVVTSVQPLGFTFIKGDN